MNIVRKLKLSKLTGIDYLSEYENKFINFVKDKILNLSEFTDNNYLDYILYINEEGKHILRYDFNNNLLYCGYIEIWYDLRHEFKLEKNDIKDIIKHLVSLLYDIDVKYVNWATMN